MSLLALARKVEAARRRFTGFSLEDACGRHLLQLALARDPSKRIAACCGRRSGKSTGICARGLDLAATKAGAQIYYCSKSLTWARDTIFMPILLPMMDAAGLVEGLDYTINRQDWIIEFTNGSRWFFLGADDLGDIKRFNGKKMHLCIVDEMQDLAEEVLTEFLDVVVKYCLFDYDGTLILAGIPSAQPAGYWWRIWQNPRYKKHDFTAYDNPLKTPEETDAWVQEECRDRGVTIDHPLIQRSIFARWVPMTDWLVYKYDPLVNGVDCLFRQVNKSTRSWRFAVGVDTGSIDRAAIVVLGQAQTNPHTHLVDEWVTGRGADLDFTALVNQLKYFRTVYAPGAWYFDPAHAGKPLMAELRNRHGFAFMESAKKTELRGQVDLVNDGLRTGRLRLPPDSETAADMMKTVWDKEEALLNRWLYSSVHHPDPSEAFRYAYQGIYASWYVAPDPRTPHQRQLDEEAARIDARAGGVDPMVQVDEVDETPEWAHNPWR